MTIEEMNEFAVKLVNEINTLNEMIEMVEWLNCRLENSIKVPFSETKENMIRLIKDGRFIASIKLYKDFYKSTIAEANLYADNLWKEIFEGKHGLFNTEEFIFKYDYKISKTYI